MKLRDLEYLVALDEERHFHRAAARCFVSQPTLSGQLRKLEERLGVRLVERSSRHVTMTDAGRAVAAQARRVLAEARLVQEVAAGFRDPLAGELQVGLIPTLAPYLLPPIMPTLRRRFPALKLWLREQQTALLLEALHEARLDLAILALPVVADEFSTIDLFEEPFQLAVPADDPLVRRRAVRMEDLNAREVLLLEEGHCLRGQALAVCVRAGASEYAGFRGTSLETLRHMVGEGIGVTLVPQLAVPPRVPARSPIRYLPFTDPAPSRRIGLLYRRGSFREPAFEAIGAAIAEAVTVARAGSS